MAQIVVFVSVLLFAAEASGLSSGAPVSACFSLSPDPIDHDGDPQSSPVPYELANFTEVFSINGSLAYKPKKTYVCKSHSRNVGNVMRISDMTNVHTPRAFLMARQLASLAEQVIHKKLKRLCRDAIEWHWVSRGKSRGPPPSFEILDQSAPVHDMFG